MNAKFIAGLSALTLVAGLAMPTVTRADASEKYELKQAKESIKFTITELKEALDEAREHGDDTGYCNHIVVAIKAAEASLYETRADLKDDK